MFNAISVFMVVEVVMMLAASVCEQIDYLPFYVTLPA